MPFQPVGQRRARRVVAMASLLGAQLCWAQPISVASSESFRLYAPLVEELLRDAGFEPHISLYPTERSYQMLMSGQVDLEFFRTQRAVEPILNKVTLIGPVSCSELAAFKRVGTPVAVRNADDLAKYRVGAQNGNKFATSLATRYGDAALPASAETLFRMLDAGRFDVAIETERTGLAQIKALNLQGSVQRVGPILAMEPVYLVLRNQLDSWGPRIQKTFAKRRASGQWVSRYGSINESLDLPRDIALHCLDK